MPPRGRGGSIGIQAEDIYSAFTLFDKNGDGFITRSEFVRILTRTGEGCAPLDEEQAINLWNDFLQDVDSDGDGKVSLEELSKVWGTGSAASAAATAKQVGTSNFASILTADAAKKMGMGWGPADSAIIRGDPPEMFFSKLLKQNYSVTWHFIGEVEGTDLKDGVLHLAVGKAAEDDELTLELFQAKLRLRLEAANAYQSRTVPLGYEGDHCIWSYDRYTKEGEHFEGGYILGAAVDDQLVELWQWAKDISKTDKESGVESRLKPKGPKDDWLGFTWFGDFDIYK